MAGPVDLVHAPPEPGGYLRLRRLAGWESPEQDTAARALANALHSVSLYCGGELVGCGRVIGDDGLYFYIQDILVDPGYRGRGLGDRIMRELFVYLQRSAAPGAFVGLMAAEGVEGFYLRFGFARRPPGRAGMFLVWPPRQPPTADGAAPNAG